MLFFHFSIIIGQGDQTAHMFIFLVIIIINVSFWTEEYNHATSPIFIYKLERNNLTMSFYIHRAPPSLLKRKPQITSFLSSLI